MKDKINADAWKRILPADVVVSCGEIDLNMPHLSLSEQASIGKVNNFRLQEFAFGRMHARKALEQIGIFNSEIPKNKQTGAPMWPKGVVGSIAHVNEVNNSYVAAVVASSEEFNALGIDVEYCNQLHPSVWSYFLNNQDFELLREVSVTEKDKLVRKVWCLKEAAIKAIGQGSMMSWSVNRTKSSDKFKLSNINLDNNIKLYGRAIVKNNFVFALVYACANKKMQISI